MKNMTKREWKVEALGYLLWMSKYDRGEAGCRNRHDTEYYNYLRVFFFGIDGELSFDCKNETWIKRCEARELPMPRNIYLFG